MGKQGSPRKLGLTKRREVDSETVGTNLYLSDRRLVDEQAEKKGVTRSAFLRDIIHQWGIKFRFAPDDADNGQQSLHALQKTAITELAEARKELQSVLRQLKEAGTAQEDLQTLNETEFKRVLARDSAHYNLSAQSFTAIWAVVQFLQRFLVDPTLARDPNHQKQPHVESVKQRESAREEGLLLIEKMVEQFQSPEQLLQMVLISPTEE